MKNFFLIIGCYLVTFNIQAQPTTEQPDLQNLQNQINTLQKQVDVLSNKQTDNETTAQSNNAASILESDRINPYASMSKTAFAYQTLKNKDVLNNPLIIGGSVEADMQIWNGSYALRSSPTAAPTYQRGSSVEVTKAYLFTAANLNDYTTVLASLLNGPLSSGPAVLLDRGFIIFGNLNKFPVYLTVGRNYFPFGQFGGNGQLDNGLSTNSFRMNPINQAVLSYSKDYKAYGTVNFNAGVYQNNSFSKSISNYGLDAKYTNKIMALTYTLGASYLNDIRGTNSDVGGAYIASSATQTNPGAKPILAGNRNDAADFNGSLSYQNYTLLGEYITTLQSTQELVRGTSVYQSQAKLSAWLLGGTYKRNIFALPTLFQLSYSDTKNMAAIPFQLSGNFNNAYKSDIGMNHMWLGSITSQIAKNLFVGPEAEYIVMDDGSNTWAATLDVTAFF